MAERLELVLQAFENTAFTGALEELSMAQQAHEKASNALWKLVYKNREDYHSSPSDVGLATEYAIGYPEELGGKELKRYNDRQKKEDEAEEKENTFMTVCADETLGLDAVSKWAIRRHLGGAVHGRDAMLGGVMTSLGHLDAVDAVLRGQPYELLTVFSRYGVIATAINDGVGLRVSERGGAVLTDTISYSLGALHLASRDMLIAKKGLTLEMQELDDKDAARTGSWSDILTLGRRKTTDLPTLIFGNPVHGPRIGDVWGKPENEEYLNDTVEKARIVAGLATGPMTLDDPSLQRFEVNPKM